jgi:type VI secretion system secreted protein VgrG
MKVSSQSFLSSPLAAFLLLSVAACGSGNAIASEKSSGSTVSAPFLGEASSFAVLGASTVTCTASSAVTGDVGVSPGISITGFNPPCTIAGTIHAGDAIAIQAHADIGPAYDSLKAAVCQHNLTGQELGGQTLAPGIYCFDTSAGLTGTLTLDGGGDANAMWMFQMGSTLTTASNASVVMAGGGTPCNVYWQVGSSGTLGTGTAFQGNILAYASITLTGGTTLVGRALAVNAAVTLDNNNVSVGSCSP